MFNYTQKGLRLVVIKFVKEYLKYCIDFLVKRKHRSSRKVFELHLLRVNESISSLCFSLFQLVSYILIVNWSNN